MGEANREFVNRNYDRAIEMCELVIQNVPFAPEPYTTLANIYYEKGDFQKALSSMVCTVFQHGLPKACMP